MNQLETAFLGAITLKLLHDLPVNQAGWIIHALAVWILDGKQPEEVPPSLVGSWIAVREESINIHNARKERSAARSDAAKARWNANGCKAMQDDASGCNEMQTDASRAPAKTKTKTEDIYTDGTADAVPSGAGDLRSAVKTPPLSCDDDLKEKSYDAWASLQADPVDVALDITGEPTAKRRVYGARLKLLGRDRFVETCCTFRAEVAAGEPVRNLGAALTKRLNDAITAKDEVGRMAR